MEPPLHLPRPEDLAAQGRQVPQRRDDGRVRALVALRARVLEAVDVALDRVDELRLMPLRRAAHRGAVQERLERREDREGLVGRRRGLELRRELRRGHVLRAVEAAEVVVGRRAVPRVAVEGRVAGAAGAAHLIEKALVGAVELAERGRRGPVVARGLAAREDGREHAAESVVVRLELAQLAEARLDLLVEELQIRDAAHVARGGGAAAAAHELQSQLPELAHAAARGREAAVRGLGVLVGQQRAGAVVEEAHGAAADGVGRGLDEARAATRRVVPARAELRQMLEEVRRRRGQIVERRRALDGRHRQIPEHLVRVDGDLEAPREGGRDALLELRGRDEAFRALQHVGDGPAAGAPPRVAGRAQRGLVLAPERHLAVHRVRVAARRERERARVLVAALAQAHEVVGVLGPGRDGRRALVRERRVAVERRADVVARAAALEEPLDGRGRRERRLREARAPVAAAQGRLEVAQALRHGDQTRRHRLLGLGSAGRRLGDERPHRGPQQLPRDGERLRLPVRAAAPAQHDGAVLAQVRGVAVLLDDRAQRGARRRAPAHGDEALRERREIS